MVNHLLLSVSASRTGGMWKSTESVHSGKGVLTDFIALNFIFNLLRIMKIFK